MRGPYQVPACIYVFPSLLDVSYIFLTYFFHHYPSQRHSGGTEACSPARCPWWSVQCGPELRAHYLGRVANQVKRQEPGKLVEVGVPFVFFPFLSSIKLMQQTHTVTLYWRSYVYNFSFTDLLLLS